jgi:hypothetical protein
VQVHVAAIKHGTMLTNMCRLSNYQTSVQISQRSPERMINLRHPLLGAAIDFFDATSALGVILHQRLSIAPNPMLDE